MDAAAEAQAAMHELLSYEFVCKVDEIPEGSRRCLLLPSSQRSVMLIHLKGQIYCMDQACYRTSTCCILCMSLSFYLLEYTNACVVCGSVCFLRRPRWSIDKR